MIVTSRSQLTGLAAAEGARPLTLDCFRCRSPSPAYRPAWHRTRRRRARRRRRDRRLCAPPAAGPDRRRCPRRWPARLPLAALAAELRDAASRLDALAGDPAQTSGRCSPGRTGQLNAAAARLSGSGLHPGPDVGARPPPAWPAFRPAEHGALAELTRAHLLTEHAPGRYACHDLLRAYAAEQARTAETGPERGGRWAGSSATTCIPPAPPIR